MRLLLLAKQKSPRPRIGTRACKLPWFHPCCAALNNDGSATRLADTGATRDPLLGYYWRGWLGGGFGGVVCWWGSQPLTPPLWSTMDHYSSSSMPVSDCGG